MNPERKQWVTHSHGSTRNNLLQEMYFLSFHGHVLGHLTSLEFREANDVVSNDMP